MSKDTLSEQVTQENKKVIVCTETLDEVLDLVFVFLINLERSQLN